MPDDTGLLDKEMNIFNAQSLILVQWWQLLTLDSERYDR